ncbi:MAG: hypothetical protein WC981_02355 [Candidatus Dojkabacteria bacterium]
MPNGLALAIVLLVVMLFLAYMVSLLLNFLTPFYTTPKKASKKIIDLFNLSSKDSFVDLGSGDGRMVFETYRRYKCKSTGYEISPVLLLFVKLKKLLLYPFNPKIQIKEESFFSADLSSYSVIYCCLARDVLEILEKKFEKELVKDTIVYTYRDRLPTKKGKTFDIDGEVVYQYTF